MTYFLILHYNEISLTDKAVESIRRMKGDKRIVTVDNASPNGSGVILERRYADSEDVHVIVNSENSGFARGNNIGYRYIKEQGQNDISFVVALNNDITFVQDDFLTILQSIYESDEYNNNDNAENAGQRGFYLAGPDVYTPNIRSHISPLDAAYKDERAVKERFDYIDRTIEIYKKRFDFTTYTRYLQDKYQGTKLLEIYNKLRKGQYSGALAYDKVAYGCVLNGACLIFDRRYVKENDILFDEETFLYAEEDFLTYRLTMQGKKIRYCPELKTLHVGQGSAGFSSMNYRKYCDKNIVTQERVRESLTKYLRRIKGE